MYLHRNVKCAGCFVSFKFIGQWICNSSNCNNYYCNSCIDTQTTRYTENWLCPECSIQQRRRENTSLSTVGTSTRPAIPSNNTLNKVNKLKLEIKRLSQEVKTIKANLKEVKLSLARDHERMDVLTCLDAENVWRLDMLEQRNREIDFLRSTVNELREELNTETQNYMHNVMEASLITSMKLSCALNKMQQNK